MKQMTYPEAAKSDDCDEASEHTDFASQQEVWAWLGQSKNQVKSLYSNQVFGFKNGVLWDFSKNQQVYITFDLPFNWQKHTPHRLIRVNGVVVHAPLDSFEGVDVVYVADPKKILGWEYYATESLSANGVSLDLCYETKEDAIARAEAMRLFDVVE